MLRFIFASAFLSIAFMPMSALAQQCGIASYYGPGFHGARTANGERFDSQALTFAHRTLPFGTRLKVVNQDNGRSITVRGNDRGPFYCSPIIDLSEGALSQIASLGQGSAKVCISKV